jgi:hypothetical protein
MTRLHDPQDGVIRRHYRKKGKPQVVEDQLTGAKRAPAAAFEPRPKKDEALSVNVESSLLAAGEPLLWGVNLEKFYAARITVGDCEALHLRAYHTPIDPKPPDEPGNPHHGSIFGIVEARDTDPNAYEAILDALSKASTIVPEPTPS